MELDFAFTDLELEIGSGEPKVIQLALPRSFL
jgi:hypothetical protein